jgi:hypothetical protein
MAPALHRLLAIGGQGQNCRTPVFLLNTGLMILHRVVENNESLHAVAHEYEVSHKTMRRIIRHVRKQRVQQESLLYSYSSLDRGAMTSK